MSGWQWAVLTLAIAVPGSCYFIYKAQTGPNRRTTDDDQPDEEIR
jgi:hypothetical protein